MTFLHARTSRFLAVFILLLVTAFASGCGRVIPEEEKAIRAELREALQRRDFARALPLAQRIVAVSPRENGSWERLVRAQLGSGDTAAAGETLRLWRRNVSKLSPKHHELFGDVALQEQNVATALDSWGKAIAADPTKVRVLRKMARLQRAQGDWKQEDATLTKILALKEDAPVLMERALCRRRLHRWTEAQDDFRRAQALAPDDAEVRRGSELFERLSKFLGEIRKLDARLAIAPSDDQLLTDRAMLFLRSEDPELALEDSQAATKLAPWAVRPRLFQGIAALELGRVAECEALGIDPRLQLSALTPECLETISRLDSEISVERKNADLYVTRAWQLNAIGQPKLALEDAQQAQQLDANLAGALIEGSYALAKLDRAEEAFEQIKRATALDANSSTAWQYRGELEMSRADYPAAIESFTRALAISKTPAVLQKREECYVKVGLLAEAEADHRALEALNLRGIE